jgi:hypothetical protein
MAVRSGLLAEQQRLTHILENMMRHSLDKQPDGHSMNRSIDILQ